MLRFIDSVIKALIRLVIFLFVVLLCFVVYAIFTLKANDITLEDSLSYIESISDKTVQTLSTNTSTNSTPTHSNIYINMNTNTDNTATNIAANNTGNINSYIKSNYYYKQLDNNSKIIYDTLEDNIDNLKEENYIIDFGTKFNSLLNTTNGKDTLTNDFQAALDAFFYDHPELFYIDLTKISLIVKYTSIGPKTTYKVSLSPVDNKNYLDDSFNSNQKVEEAIKEVEDIKYNFIKTLPSNSSDYDKALKVHDVLVNSLEYDSTYSKANSHNIYGALVENSVVCEGYAKAYKYILDSLNIECILVGGNATNSSGETESHMWNYIKLDGNWYGVDVTWDDPIVIGGFTKNIIRHNYFAKGSDTFSKSHVIDGRISEDGKIFSTPKLSTSDYK